MIRIVVVGDALADVVARHAGPLARLNAGSDTAARIELRGGGSAANVAAWLAAGGSPVAYVGRVGDDLAGRSAVAELRAYGVDAHVRTDAARPTGACVVLVAPDGERTMLTDRGAAGALAPGDLPDALFAAPGHLHLSGYVLLGEESRRAGLRALELAVVAGMTVSVDASSAAPLAAAGPARFLREVAPADLLLANEDEAAVLGGLPALTEAGRQAVVKLGAEGSRWSDGVREAYAPAAPTTVVDTTGAGDAFAAGFLPAWLAGATPGDALAGGAHLAARAVARTGARPRRPTGG